MLSLELLHVIEIIVDKNRSTPCIMFVPHGSGLRMVSSRCLLFNERQYSSDGRFCLNWVFKLIFFVIKPTLIRNCLLVTGNPELAASTTSPTILFSISISVTQQKTTILRSVRMDHSGKWILQDNHHAGFTKRGRELERARVIALQRNYPTNLLSQILGSMMNTTIHRCQAIPDRKRCKTQLFWPSGNQ